MRFYLDDDITSPRILEAARRLIDFLTPASD
jgi:hypothetical protein